MGTKLLDTKAVSEWTGIPELTLKDWRYRNRGPAFMHLGRRVMYREQDVEAFIADALRKAAR